MLDRKLMSFILSEPVGTGFTHLSFLLLGLNPAKLALVNILFEVLLQFKVREFIEFSMV